MNWPQLNYVAILIAAIASMVLGFLWYSPGMFGKQWAKARGLDMSNPEVMAKMKATMGQTYTLTFVAVLVSALALAILIARIQLRNPLLGGIKTGVLVWIGFVATVQLTGNLFGTRNRQSYFIDAGYQLVCYVVMGAILGCWR